MWDKREEMKSNNFADCELAWTSFDNPARIYRFLWNGMIRKGNEKEELYIRVHPTQKPVGLMVDILRDFPSKNVVDLFGGSGSTLIACEKLKRNCYLGEIDPYYCRVILRRYEKYTGEKSVKLISQKQEM